jgi:hypothetical protein
MTINTYKDFLTNAECQSLLAFMDKKSITGTITNKYNKEIGLRKSIDYEISFSIARKILHPKITNLIGSHDIDSGSYIESNQGFGLHTDSHEYLKGCDCTQENPNNLDIGILIPLASSPEFNTIFFDYQTVGYIDFDHFEIDDRYQNDLSSEIDHLIPSQRKVAQHLPVKSRFYWNVGDICVFSRSILHCAANFNDDLCRKWIVIFI